MKIYEIKLGTCSCSFNKFIRTNDENETPIAFVFVASSFFPFTAVVRTLCKVTLFFNHDPNRHGLYPPNERFITSGMAL